jgi:hypothetical protein
MNGPDRIFMNAGNRHLAARILGVASTAALLSACADFTVASVKVDPNSAIAPEVAKVAAAQKSYPKFSDIPPAPTDVRPPQQYGQRARDVVAAGAQLDAATAPSTWALSNTQGFTAQARRQVGPDLNAGTAADTETFANTVRKRATPPPPVSP